VPLHFAPLRGLKLGACHAAGHMLLGSNMPSTCFIFPIPALLIPLSSPLLRQAKHSIILIASGIPRPCCKGVSTINLPSLERRLEIYETCEDRRHKNDGQRVI